ncbi:MAG TPA: hypothetical protein VMH05_15420 [Bryobacteraceae bacterium]|nr:hypothetical protein [Bryobacteraceae bacterium]
MLRIAEFLASIGIVVRAGELPAETFLPGIAIDRGVLVIDEDRLMYPGDLLHEAGHLALMPAEERANAGSDTGNDGGVEMGATAWSFAAATEMKLPLEIVFHDGGYRGESKAIIENFTQGRYFGVPILVWLGLTVDPLKPDGSSIPPFPNMRRWLR